MLLNNQRGQTLVATMAAIGLLAILILISSQMGTYIANTMYRVETQEKTVALDVDLANLMVIPQLCTCNLIRNVERGAVEFNTSNLNQVIELNSLRFYTDPPEDLTSPSCQNGTQVIATGMRHAASELILGKVTIGPFSPLGDRNSAGSFIATIKVENWDSSGVTGRPDIKKAKNLDAEVKVVVATESIGGTRRRVTHCGVGAGTAPTTTRASFGRVFYRFVQYSMNFGCTGVPGTEHPEQVEPYVMTRNQYFWPAEEGNLMTEFESTRIAASPVAPVSFSGLVGTAICFEDLGIGDRASLILPGHNMDQCASVKNTFLNGAPEIIDIGFSLKDNCRSRFF